VQVEGMGAQPLHVPPGKGRDHLDFALYELIRASQDGKTPFHEAILTRLPRVPARSTAVLVSGSVFIDLAAIGGVIEAMRSRGTRAAVFLVNNFSFPAISGWPPPRVEIVEKTREAVFYLRSRGVPVRVLEESDELETALGKEGFSE
jgi:uncharacterized protein (DUF58 family)